MKTNREKNIEHDSRQVIRPKAVSYNFEPLEQAIKSWFAPEQEEVYSPYLGAL
jgi:hypothetical protein